MVLSKSKKLLRELEENGKELMSKEEFVGVVIANKNNTLLYEEINYMLLHGFCLEKSADEIILKKRKILECMYGLMGDTKYLTSIFMRSNFAHFMPSEFSN